jgi:hypothetical protein
MSTSEMIKQENSHPSYSGMGVDKKVADSKLPQSGFDVKSFVNGCSNQINPQINLGQGFGLEEDMGLETKKFKSREEQYSAFYGQQFK